MKGWLARASSISPVGDSCLLREGEQVAVVQRVDEVLTQLILSVRVVPEANDCRMLKYLDDEFFSQVHDVDADLVG